MKLRILKELLKRYHEGTANRAEQFLVDRWYDSFGDNSQKIPGIENEQRADETGQRIFNKIKLWETVKPWYYRPGFQIACGITFISTLLFFLYASLDHRPIANPIVYQTLKGQTKKILLKDNTCVWLNSNSKLEILPGYGRNKRMVKLEGEAYFEVSHNVKQPFLVHAGELITNVLGTSFTVQAYKKSRFARVTLLTGKVWVKITHPGPDKLPGTMLIPNQSLLYDYRSKMITKTNVAFAASSKAWIDGKLIFDNTPMLEVSEILSRAFGLNIKLNQAKLNDCRIYGQFEMNDRPEKVVKMICKLISANYTIQGNEVKIKGEGCDDK